MGRGKGLIVPDVVFVRARSLQARRCVRVSSCKHAVCNMPRVIRHAPYYMQCGACARLVRLGAVALRLLA